jgi:KDO2-lipid IV(A) lauroyltransferase
MRTRSAIRNGAEYGAALAVLKTLEWTPPALALALARTYARLLDCALPRLRRVAYRNLALALPELGAARQREIVDGVFRSIARVLVAFAKFPAIRRDTVKQWLRCEGLEYVEEALRQGRGVLFATAHLGNWELSAYAHALLAAPMDVVVRPFDNPLIDALIERRRGLSGNRMIGKKEYARSILKALAANRAVGILVDQNSAADAGVFVDFFGVKACAGTGFVKLGGGRKTLRAALPSAGADDRRRRARHPTGTKRIGARDPPVPRSVVVDPSPLENAAARRSGSVLNPMLT